MITTVATIVAIGIAIGFVVWWLAAWQNKRNPTWWGLVGQSTIGPDEERRLVDVQIQCMIRGVGHPTYM